MKPPSPTATAEQVAKFLIEREAANLAAEGKWLLDSAEVVSSRLTRDNTVNLSLVRDVIVNAEGILARLTAIETLKRVLPT